MGHQRDGWQQSERLAWVGHDTPAPPRVGRGIRLALAAVLGTAVAGMLATDTLRPDHRAWVLTLGTIGIGAAATAFVALLRASWISMPLTLGGAVAGISIGIIDMAHDPTRSTMIAVGFAAISAVALALVIADVRRSEWDRSLRPMPQPTGSARTASPTAPTSSTAAPALAVLICSMAAGRRLQPASPDSGTNPWPTSICRLAPAEDNAVGARGNRRVTPSTTTPERRFRLARRSVAPAGGGTWLSTPADSMGTRAVLSTPHAGTGGGVPAPVRWTPT